MPLLSRHKYAFENEYDYEWLIDDKHYPSRVMKFCVFDSFIPNLIHFNICGAKLRVPSLLLPAL